MKNETISRLLSDFEDYRCERDGVEFWFARELQNLLGYSKWENFEKVIEKAKHSCQQSGQNLSDHFLDVRKTIQMPKGATKEISDSMLTRYACYLIAQNGDPRKEQIAFAQSYRSEEHTSELQSHSFISYAVFCLKKKNHLLFFLFL